jgi:hypothetical protein
LVIIVVCFSARSAHAGAWTQDQWHFYLQLSSSFSFADKRFNIHGDQVPILVTMNHQGLANNPKPSNFQQLLEDFYFELGVFPRVTFFGDFLFMNSQRQDNPGGDVHYYANGVGDLLLGLRLGVLQVPFLLSIEARVWTPTGDVSALPPLGQGDIREELRAVATKALDRIPLYFDLEFGFTYRGNASFNNQLLGPTVVSYQPEIVAHGEIGATLIRYSYDRLILTAALEHRQSTSLPVNEPTALTIIPPRSLFTTVSGSLLVYFFRNMGVNLRFSQAVAGRLLPSMTTVGAGLFGTY